MSIMEENNKCVHCGRFIPYGKCDCYMKQLHKRMTLKSKKRKKKRGQMSWAEERDLGLV